MKKSVFISFFLLLSTFSFAQKQDGFVKTIGRPGKPGHGLGQAEVRIKGDVNKLLSNDSGEFSFDISRAEGTNTFVISSVRKKGYVIADNDLTKRQNPYSSIPTVIVMVSEEELDADTRAIEEKTRQAVQANYEQCLMQLEQQFTAASINEERYREELSALMDWYDNIDNLVAKMAEYYARVDYDMLSEEDALINQCIEMGQLDRADSLIDARGDIFKRFSDAKNQISQGQKMQASGAAIEQDGLARLHSARQDAEHKYNIAIARFDNVSALNMLKQLAESDTTSFDYRIRLADFYRKNVIDYSASEQNYKAAYEIALAQNDTLDMVSCLNNRGLLFQDMGRYQESSDYLQRALDLRMAYSNEFTVGLISLYNNMIEHLITMKQYSEAFEKGCKLLSLIDSSELKDTQEMIMNRHFLSFHMANCLAMEGKYDEAEKMMAENLQIALDNFGRNSYMAFHAYMALGWLYDHTARSEKAIEADNEAIDIATTIYGDTHVDVAALYSNISCAYRDINENEKAYDYAFKALELRRNLLGNMHPDVALSLHNIGTMFVSDEKFEESIPYFLEAAKIREIMLPAQDPSSASTYQHLAMSYAALDVPDYHEAIIWGKRAFSIFKEVKGEEFNCFASKFSLARCLLLSGDYDSAVQECRELCEISTGLIGPDSEYIVMAYMLLSSSYKLQGDLLNAFETAIVAFNRQIESDGSNFRQVTAQYCNVLLIYEDAMVDDRIAAVADAKMKDFLRGLVPVMIIDSEESPAGKAGLMGAYDILHYNDWDFVDNPQEFFRYNGSQKANPKDVVVMRDGKFYSHKFGPKIGCAMSVRAISPQEHKAVSKNYKKYRKSL